jgi:hypothetical protein
MVGLLGLNNRKECAPGGTRIPAVTRVADTKPQLAEEDVKLTSLKKSTRKEIATTGN